MITDSREMMVLSVAGAHYESDPCIRDVYQVVNERGEDHPEEPIKLLEVNENTIESGIEPLYFGPDPANQMPFGLVIIDITPREFRLLQEGGLSLPKGWRLGRRLNVNSKVPA